jgi:ribosomal protein S12 methylthiotransferase accessory factor
MLELKAQLHLLMGNTEEALAAFEFGSNRLGHVIAELIRMEEEELVWEEYEEALYNIFGRERVQKALKILSGEAFYIDTSLHADYRNMLGMYDRLQIKKVFSDRLLTQGQGL